MEYTENWEALEQILYKNGLPRKMISTESLDEIIDQVDTLEEALLSTYFGNNQELANLVESGAILFNFFALKLSPEAKVYFKLGELNGALNVMAKIVSNSVQREQVLHVFNRVLESFPCAKEIILLMGEHSSAIKEEDLLNKMKKDFEEKDLKDALNSLELSVFINSHRFGPFCNLFLSDKGRIVYHHYKKPKGKEIYYHA